MKGVDMADRIELRRFVGRELLLWLWLESELFEATLETREHGSFGLWLEGRLVLNEGRESTVIRGSSPGRHREAKEALLRGKTPDRAGLHLSFGDHDCTLTLRGDTLAFAGLTPPREKRADDAPVALLAPQGRPRRRKADEPTDLAHESFYERMRFAREVEELVTALYRDFLALRLSPAWEDVVAPVMQAWVAGEEVDADDYRAARDRALGSKAHARRRTGS